MKPPFAWFVVPTLCIGPADAFAPSRPCSHDIILRGRRRPAAARTKIAAAPDDPSFDGTEDGSNEGDSRRVPNELGLDIVRGVDSDISDETWGDIESGAPSRWMVMKDLLGINIFTYILAAFIIFFLSMNAAFGPGWLGQSLGWEDVGTFTKVSDSLPLNVDVSGPDYLL